MNLTKRFLLANAATVIIPLIITALLALAAVFVLNKSSEITLSLENYQKLAEIKTDMAGTPDSILNRSPAILEEKHFQSYLQERLSEINGHAILLRNDQLIYTTHDFSKIDIAKCLEIGKKTKNKPLFTYGDISYTVELIALKTPTGVQENLLLLAPVASAGSGLSTLLIFIVIAFLCSFTLTSILLSRQYSRTIVTPLQNLQKAAAEISKGNLDYQIAEEGDKEIQALCRDLELMRIKLKESIHTQLKYEDNRKMLISSISHDLKTPVTTIKGYIEGIRDGIANTPAKTEKYLNIVYCKACQIDQMIDDLLLYAKLDLNQLPFNFIKTDIASYLENFLSQNCPEPQDKEIEIRFQNLLTAPREVRLDPDRMTRVLTNIMDNSLKHIDKTPGKITISLRETSSSVTMEFRDNGSGIREKDLPHIFDRFYRSDSSRSEIKGSGLGLAIAKQIVEGHQGQIWAVSHGSEGTSILISLRKI